MQYNNSSELCKLMSEKTNGVSMLAFSCGKDAIASWVEMRKHFKTIIPIYYYTIPGLSFIEKSLKYYEDFFETKIIRLPNPNFIRMLNNGVYQTPTNNKIIKSFGFPPIKREHLCEQVKIDFNIDSSAYVAIGNRASDNLQRQRSIYKRNPDGSIKEVKAVNDSNKTFYPVYDFNIADVVKSIREANVRLPHDYIMWGKTFDGLDYRFIKPIKDNYPDDYEKIKSYFPFIDLEIIRYEQL